MYKYLKDRNGLNRTDAILRVSDGATIPNDTHNKDWIIYQAWLSYGNIPLSA